MELLLQGLSQGRVHSSVAQVLLHLRWPSPQQLRSFARFTSSTVSTTRHVAKELGQGDVHRQEVVKRRGSPGWAPLPISI